MERFERFARDLMARVETRDLRPLLESLTDDELVKLLAGTTAATPEARYQRNVIATELLNRIGGKSALFDASLDPRVDGFEPFTEALARALRADMACVDEVDGTHFILHGKNRLPEGFRDVTRCRRESMPMCAQVLDTLGTVVVDDLAAHPRWCQGPACAKFGLQSYAAAPGFDDKGRVVCVVWVANYRPHRWTKEEIGLLERVAQRLAREFPFAGAGPLPVDAAERAPAGAAARAPSPRPEA